MCELKLFDYQKEVIESKDIEIICNWSRNLGKDYTLVSKIINDKLNDVIWVGNFYAVKNKVEEVLQINNLMSTVKNISFCKDKINIEFNDRTHVNIQIYSKDCEDNNVDLLVFNGILPYEINIKAKQIISMISVNNYDKKLQKLFPNLKINEQGKDQIEKQGLMTPKMIARDKMDNINRYYDEIDILSVPENIVIYDKRNNRLEELLNTYSFDGSNIFLIQTLAKLQTEYDEIIPTKDNVLTRQNLLKMIMDLQRNLPCKRE